MPTLPTFEDLIELSYENNPLSKLVVKLLNRISVLENISIKILYNTLRKEMK